MMGKYTQRGIVWEFINSYPVLLTFFYPFSFSAFFVMGHKTRCRKWTYAGFVYLAAILSPFVSMTRPVIGLSVLSCFICIIHAFCTRKEYLIRLDAFLSSGYLQDSDRKLKENIRKEYSGQKEPAAPKAKPKPAPPPPPPPPLDPGQAYVQRIRELNDAIPDETISDYLSEMELFCGKIFDYIKKHPEKANLIKPFTSYHLPESLKLLEAYKELNDQQIKGSNILSSMHEIEGMLTSILEATKNLYDNLYSDQAFDIATDVKVLKDSLAQTGLIDSDGHIKL